MNNLAIFGGKPVLEKKIGYGHQYIDDAETPEATVMAIRAAMVKKIMRRPTWSEFHNEFPDAKCSKSSLERLTDLSEEHYEDSKDYDALLERFGLL